MIKRELLSTISDPDLKVVAAKFLDKVMQSGKNHEKVFTAFLSPLERSTCEKLFWKCHEDLKLMSFGGYQEAEYQMLGLSPSYLELQEADFPIKLMIAKVRSKSFELTHRDILGALMALGFQRNRIGDLTVVENEIQILCDEDMAAYIGSQLEKIGRYSVDCEFQPLEAYRQIEVEMNEHFATVPSLRLDAVIAAGFNISRNSALELIQGEKVKVNHLPEHRSAHLVSEGDLISCRGKGRLILKAVEGTSKKDRIKIRISKMG